MEEEDEWSPETKLWPFVAPLCTQITSISAGKLSQFIAHYSNKAMASEWHQLSTRGFHRVSNKKQTCHPPRKYRVQGESVLDHCVCGYVKSGHI